MKKHKIVFIKKLSNFFQKELFEKLVSKFPNTEIKIYSCMNCALDYVEKNKNISIIIFGNNHSACEKHQEKLSCFNLYLNRIKENKIYKKIHVIIYPAMTTINEKLLRKQDRRFTLEVESTHKIINKIRFIFKSWK